MPIVSNSGPLLSFARARRLDLLREVVGELIIPEAVYEEIVFQGAGRPGAAEVQEGAWIRRASVRNRSLVYQLPERLQLGESEAIALAQELGASLLVDEREARREAIRLGVSCLGSLRVLQEAKERGIISEVKPILDELIAAGMHISDSLYKEFLQAMDE